MRAAGGRGELMAKMDMVYDMSRVCCSILANYLWRTKLARKRWFGLQRVRVEPVHAVCVGISSTTNGASRRRINGQHSTYSLGLPVSVLAVAAHVAAVVTGALGTTAGVAGGMEELRTLLITTIGSGVIIILWLLRLLQTGNTARWTRPRRPRRPQTHGQTTTTRTIPKIRNNPSQIPAHLWAQTQPRRSPSSPRTGNRRSSSRLSRSQHHGHPHQTQPPFIPALTPFSSRTPRSESPSSSPTSIQTPRWPSHIST